MSQPVEAQDARSEPAEHPARDARSEPAEQLAQAQEAVRSLTAAVRQLNALREELARDAVREVLSRHRCRLRVTDGDVQVVAE